MSPRRDGFQIFGPWAIVAEVLAALLMTTAAPAQMLRDNEDREAAHFQRVFLQEWDGESWRSGRNAT